MLLNINIGYVMYINYHVGSWQNACPPPPIQVEVNRALHVQQSMEHLACRSHTHTHTPAAVNTRSSHTQGTQVTNTPPNATPGRGRGETRITTSLTKVDS